MSQPQPFHNAAIDASRQKVAMALANEARRNKAEAAARQEAEMYLRMAVLGDNYAWDNGMLPRTSQPAPLPYFERPRGW